MANEPDQCGNCTFRRGAECRKNPPVMSMKIAEGMALREPRTAFWPIVNQDDWCGRYHPTNERAKQMMTCDHGAPLNAECQECDAIIAAYGASNVER